MSCFVFGAGGLIGRVSDAVLLGFAGGGSVAKGRGRDDVDRLMGSWVSALRPATVVGAVMGALVAGVSAIVYGVALVSGSRLLPCDETAREAGVAKAPASLEVNANASNNSSMPWTFLT